MTHRRDFHDLDYTVVAEQTGAGIVTFKIYEIGGTNLTENGKPTVDIFWNRKNWKSLPDPVTTLDEAQIWLEGSVKFDGCSNWHFEECMAVHFCTKEQCENLGKLLTMCWEWAFEIAGWPK